MDSRNAVQAELDRIDAAGAELLSSDLEPDKLKALVEMVSSIDRKIQNCDLDSEAKIDLRAILCNKVRNIAFEVYSNKGNSAVTKYLFCFLSDQFADEKELQSILSHDMEPLNNDVAARFISVANYKSFLEKYIGPKAMKSKMIKNRIKYLIIGIAVLVGLFFVVKSCTAPKPEFLYTDDSKVNDNVYVDVVSIVPVEGIYKQGNSFYSGFICECVTDKGEGINVYVSSSDYKKYINSNISDYVNSSITIKGTEFNPAARIHGRITTRGNIISASVSKEKIIRFISIEYLDQ